MAITVLLELKILKGDIGPSVILVDLVHQIAMGEGVSFHTKYKVFDTVELVDDVELPINTEANSYLNKVLGVISRVYQVDSHTINSLKKVVVSLIGNSSHDWEAVQDATDENWETFITENMLRTFELLGRVLKEEKTAYEAI